MSSGKCAEAVPRAGRKQTNKEKEAQSVVLATTGVRSAKDSLEVAKGAEGPLRHQCTCPLVAHLRRPPPTLVRNRDVPRAGED